MILARRTLSDAPQLFGVPLRVLEKGCCTSKRTEVVRLLIQQQAPNCTLWIDSHLTNRVDRQVIGSLVHANDGEDFDRLRNIAPEPAARATRRGPPRDRARALRSGR